MAGNAGERKRCDFTGWKVYLEKENLGILFDEIVMKWEFWAIALRENENIL